jgi:hypothetical protein
MAIRAKIRAAKLQRIRAGAPPRLLELCSGCGGLSLGMSAAGFRNGAEHRNGAAGHLESPAFALGNLGRLADLKCTWHLRRLLPL